MSLFRLGALGVFGHTDTTTVTDMKRLLRRHLSLMLALRYLNPLRTMFSVITLICLLGVALGVMVLIVVLSVMSGLQREMESRVLAFTPHFLVSYYEGPQRAVLTEENTNWPELVEKIKALPGVVTAYPQLESESLVQSDRGRMTSMFRAIDASDEKQMAALQPLVREGTFDFGAGLDEQAVISYNTAKGLGLHVGDRLHVTPVGSFDEVAKIYALIQNPLATHANETFMKEIAALVEGEGAAASGLPAERLESIRMQFRSFDPEKLRGGEREELDALWALLSELEAPVLPGGKTVSCTPEWRKSWREHVAALASLDRDKEDGKTVRRINEFVMPVDLTIIGIYQAPENMTLGPAVFVPLEIGQQMLGFNQNGNNAVQGIAVRVKDPNNTGDLQQRIIECLPPGAAPSPEKPYGGYWAVTSWHENFKTWARLIANERTMMSFVLSSIALIASFCIMAVMFTVSMQRKREIAVLQALGATPAKIMRVFVWQGVIIGFVGALLGIALALLVLHYRLEIQGLLAGLGVDPFPMEGHGIALPCHIEGHVLVWQALQAFVMVTIAATIPAFFVSRQDPSKALRAN